MISIYKIYKSLKVSNRKSTISKNQKAVDDFKAGNAKSLEFLVGQVMRESKGRADIKTAREILENKLKYNDDILRYIRS